MKTREKNKNLKQKAKTISLRRSGCLNFGAK